MKHLQHVFLFSFFYSRAFDIRNALPADALQYSIEALVKCFKQILDRVNLVKYWPCGGPAWHADWDYIF